ncbi:hypothetical protein ACEN8I_05700 [Polaromonas sp. CT11-55]|uniref:hypothetical protein n=1 Tax=Polaromonas sp. CT11-55 TaxID=3243045 RepID=UPI0039A6D3B3
MNPKFLSASLLALALPLMAHAATGGIAAPAPRASQPAATLAPVGTSLQGLPPPVAATTKPNVTVPHTKITLVEAPVQVKAGSPLTVKVFGTGLETQCTTTVLIGHNGNTYFKKGPVQYGTGAWPRVASFLLEPGTYQVRISMTEGGPSNTQAEREACGMNGIPGDGAIVVVGDAIPK